MVDKGLHQAFGDFGEVTHVRAELHAESELARLVVEQPKRGSTDDLDDGLGVLLSHLLDLHAALGAAHDDDRLGAAIHGGPQVIFLLDVGGIGHEHALDQLAFGVLLVLQELAQDILGVLARGLHVPGVLDAARLAAPAHHNLGLDHNGPAYAPGYLLGLLGRVGDLALIHGHAILGKQLFSLVLVELHSAPLRDFRFCVGALCGARCFPC